MIDCAKYRITPSSTSVLQGQTVILQCAFYDLTTKDIATWEGPPDLQSVSMRRIVNPKYPRHHIVGDESKGTFNLQISNVQLKDGGRYRCGAFGLDSKEATLTVIVPLPRPPVIKGAELPTKAGQQLTLSCSSTGGHPQPRLTWYNESRIFKHMEVIHHESAGRTVVDLVLPGLTRWDNGVNFTCTADQGYPQLTQPKASSAILSVHYPPTVIVPQTSVHVREGNPANLSCLVDSNPPAMVTWRKLGHGLVIKGKNENRGQTMSLPKASRYDSGVYECTADNGVLPHGMGTATLDVQYAPWIDPTMDDEITLMHDQEGFKLRCLADGNPKPHIRWRRKDTTLYWENPLRFHRVRYDVEGTYQCVATSGGFQEVTKDTFINIVGRPQLLGEESVSATAVAAGGTARFACDITADPMPDRVIWLWRDRDGIEKELTVASGEFITINKKRDMDVKSSSSSLTIKDVAYKNEGTYICRASNMFGSVQRNFQLQLTESDHVPAIIIATTAGIVLVVTIVIIGISVAKKKGLICVTRPPEPLGVSSPRPMPPIPKYGRKRGHGTNDSGVEDLELQEVDGTMKPRPPPRVDKEWKAVGLTYTGLVHSTSLPPYSTVERHRPDGEDIGDPADYTEETVAQIPPPLDHRSQKKPSARRGVYRGSELEDVVDVDNEVP
ncbi:kin of IRRE-like protein 1 [Branchiostoma floridae x Branchiostoma japonicum]